MSARCHLASACLQELVSLSPAHKRNGQKEGGRERVTWLWAPAGTPPAPSVLTQGTVPLSRFKHLPTVPRHRSLHQLQVACWVLVTSPVSVVWSRGWELLADAFHGYFTFHVCASSLLIPLGPVPCAVSPLGNSYLRVSPRNSGMTPRAADWVS